MKITTIRATPVNIPMEAPFLWSVGAYPGNTRTVVEVMTEAGLVGLGEASAPEHAALINERLGPALVGADPFDIEACERRCVPETRVDSNTGDRALLRAFGGIEMALWDLRGKAWGQPLYQLLGGAVRREIPFSEYFAFRERAGEAGGESTPAQVAEYCARMRDEFGSTIFEGKCVRGEPGTTVRMVREIRAALGEEAVIRLDANMGFTLDTMRRLLADLEPYRLGDLEDPAATFYEMAQLRQHSTLSFSSHSPDLRLAVELGVPDYFVLNLTQMGGIARTLRFGAACEEMGVGVWGYSGETGLGTAAYLHVIAATRHMHQPSQSLFRWQTDDVIEEGPYQPKNNVLPVPEGPGLGVTLSPVGLARCHERFCQEGPYDIYGDPRNPRMYARLPLA